MGFISIVYWVLRVCVLSHTFTKQKRKPSRETLAWWSFVTNKRDLKPIKLLQIQSCVCVCVLQFSNVLRMLWANFLILVAFAWRRISYSCCPLVGHSFARLFKPIELVVALCVCGIHLNLKQNFCSSNVMDTWLSFCVSLSVCSHYVINNSAQ